MVRRHVGGFSKQNKLPGGGVNYSAMEKGVDSVLQKQFGNYKFIIASRKFAIVFKSFFN